MKLQKLADESRIPVEVSRCGKSNWDKVKDLLLRKIPKNWSGRPLAYSADDCKINFSLKNLLIGLMAQCVVDHR